MRGEIGNRDYISAVTCARFAEVCRLRYMRLMDIQEQVLFESLENLCKQAGKYAKRAEQQDDGQCPYCGMRPAFDGAWHKPECPTLNHPVSKVAEPDNSRCNHFPGQTVCEWCKGTGAIDAPTSSDDPSCPECDGEGHAISR